MPFDTSAVGKTTDAFEFTYDWQDTVLYALGVGAREDELEYLYEGQGPKVLPTFAVVPTQPAVSVAMASLQGPYDRVVHASQRVVLHAPIPPAATLSSVGKVTALRDMGENAEAEVHTTTVDSATGKTLFETERTILFLGCGGFSGSPVAPAATLPEPAGDPDLSIEETTLPVQSLLYRLSGDWNPLHADPKHPLLARFEGRPILHGLCTFGHMARAIVKVACDGDGDRLRSVSGRFARPVWPGQTLVTDLWLDGAKVRARVRTKARGEIVVADAFAEVVG